MQYIRQGSGPVLVFQHGFLSGAGYWRNQIDYFAQSFNVIATNLPGYGDNAESPPLDTIEDGAWFVMDLLDRLNVGRFSLVGHSMGGMIAQETAIIAPQRVQKLILYGTGPDGLLPGRFESIADSKWRVGHEGKEGTIKTTVASWFLNKEAHPDYPAALELAMRVNASTMLAGYSAWQRWRAVERLDQITAETLIVRGAEDRSYPGRQIDRLLDGIQNSRLRIMPRCSHNAHLENPALFNRIVDEFLSP